ncbi:deoxyribonuclease IV [Bifidobacterium jacchi]|uniref:Probable endonuclease 4 n=1 Tax=Bifidobacterium jacchi TaxID=2490545 RepID=A0A5N5RMR3_9BIFI|nr:deoxyribonuclease IV [Bifidobacterium jacchi]
METTTTEPTATTAATITDTTTTPELLIGSHLSTAGGWDALIKRSHEEGGSAFAFFPRSPYGKRSKALDPAQAGEFGARLKAEHYGPLVVHAPYVYNLAGKDEAKRAFAIEALAEDIELLTPIREAGQETTINIHPGAHVGQGTDTGCRLISEGLNRVLERASGVMVLLETMAGKGTECGRSFEELAAIIDGVDDKEHIGVTLDTCHVLDAGYDLVSDYDGVKRRLDNIIGLDRVKAIHVNDSQFGLGSHKDRHANIGEGQLGIPFFTRLVNDPDMARLPMILETKEVTPATHREEIALLRSLVA